MCSVLRGLFFPLAASCIVMSPAHAQRPTDIEASQLPAVTVIAPEATPKKPKRRAQPAPRARPSRSATAAPLTPATSPAANGVTSASASSGTANLQPTAASETRVSGEEFNARPASRAGELLEAVPGLIVTQHSGEGKANQYFLRGFNLDHGTDLAIKVDGMPVNMPTHGHGQGRHQLPDSGAGPVGQRPQGTLFRRPGRFRFRGRRRHRLYQQAAKEHRGIDVRKFRLSARIGRRIDAGGRRHPARGR